MESQRSVVDTDTVRHAYRRWAPIYDYTFGQVADAGRKHAVRIINKRKGRVLEVGVGTGLSLPGYGEQLTVTGIDLSPEMLEKAQEKVTKKKLGNVDGLHEMDASALAFADESFDTVVAMYVMTVVPDPDKVMRELERVCAPGGEVILVNHFSQEEGVRGFLEKKLAPFADLIGWHAVFEVDRVLICNDLRLVERRSLWPIGLFTMLRFVKEPGFGVAPQAARYMLAKGRREAPARAPEPIRVRAMRMTARGGVFARRLLDTNYWRSLYRRLQSQLTE
ncbi:class I SAM-dependent methyltransferase [Methyloceanibacter sp.]|uniref:class I SAM-dependent methyltransferase n=1 Tax=Methyloceanibacter sp. TaxID=1965321 RepID=UPI00356422C6